MAKPLEKKVVLFMVELAPFCDLVLVRDLVLLYLQDLHPQKKSIGKGFGFPIPSGFASQTNPLVKEFGFTIPSGFASQKNPLEKWKGYRFHFISVIFFKKNPWEKWKGNRFYFISVIFIKKIHWENGKGIDFFLSL